MAAIRLTEKQREVLIAYRDNLHFEAKNGVVRALEEKGLLEDNPDYATRDTARYYRISESGRRLLETGSNRTVKQVESREKLLEKALREICLIYDKQLPSAQLRFHQAYEVALRALND